MSRVEQRRAPRTAAPQAAPVAVVDVESGVDFRGELTDESASGLRFRARLEPAVGADMHVTVFEGDAPRRTAEVQVVRVDRAPSGEFEVAGRWVSPPAR